MSLSRTFSRLKRGQQAFAAAFPTTSAGAGASQVLVPLRQPFANPGALHGFQFIPSGARPPRGLMVVLHGCTQNAAGYDAGAGWSMLAEREGFALLYPEQNRANNHNLCFNWYQAGDAARGVGEPASIAAMVMAMQEAHGIGAARTFVTGLSAGGAMAAVMLATYPELFAGGAVIAGLPYGVARNLGEAFDCMGGRLPRDPMLLAAKVRAASPHAGPWPRLSVWHGSADRIVAPGNSDALIAQWTALHGLAPAPDRVEPAGGHERRVWLAPDGREAIEYYLVDGMAHGTPLMPGTGEGQSGRAGAHMLDVGLSSTDRIAAFFGLAPGSRPEARPRERATPQPSAPPSPIEQTIRDALRAAGLVH